MAIYQSNLRAPDLRPYFRLLDPPMQHCGYDAPSDPDFDPRCTYWTMDEAAILYNVAKSVPAGTWVDIGARLGWTAAHLAEAGQEVYAVDPELESNDFCDRFDRNTEAWGIRIYPLADTREGFLKRPSIVGLSAPFDGFVIDGNHDSPEPLNDAKGALAHAKPDCIIMFHDTLGTAVRDGVRYLMDQGWRCRMYWTPNGVACCWRGHGGWMPPDHVPDPKMDFAPHKALMVDMQDYWERCE